MVAKPDFKTGFVTDSNPDLTKNYDPVWNPVFRFKTVLNPDFGFKPGLKSRLKTGLK